MIQLLKTDRSNRSPVTDFSGGLGGITVRTPGHRGPLTLDNRPESALYVSLGGRRDVTSRPSPGPHSERYLLHQSFSRLHVSSVTILHIQTGLQPKGAETRVKCNTSLEKWRY